MSKLVLGFLAHTLKAHRIGLHVVSSYLDVGFEGRFHYVRPLCPDRSMPVRKPCNGFSTHPHVRPESNIDLCFGRVVFSSKMDSAPEDGFPSRQCGVESLITAPVFRVRYPIESHAY